MGKEINKIIVKYTAITAFILTTALFIGSLLGAIIFPKQAGAIAYELGWHDVSEHYHEMAYKNSGDINDLYNALLVSTTSGNNKKIVKHYQDIVDHKDYESLMLEIKLETENLHLTPVVMQTLLNEQNYFAKKYASALISLGQAETAFEFALNNLTLQTSLLEPKVFVLSQVLVNNWQNNEDLVFMITRVQDGELLNGVEKVLELFNSSVNLFNSSYEAISEHTTVIEVAYMLNLSNSIRDIATAITLLHKDVSFIAQAYELPNETEINNLIALHAQKVKVLFDNWG